MTTPLVLRSVTGAGDVLTPAALQFLGELETRFGSSLRALLSARKTQQNVYSAGYLPDFLSETNDIRSGDWKAASSPLACRSIGGHGPADKSSLSAAILAGVEAFLADLEDATSPRFDHMIEAQANLSSLKGEDTTVIVRPRALHVQEDNLLVAGRPMSAALFDFGLHAFHNAEALVKRGTGPVYGLAKLENHREARLWNDIFMFTEDRLALVPDTIKAVAQIETLRAAFEMDEIIHELRGRILGLSGNLTNFAHSYIKVLRSKPDCVLPHRNRLTMDQDILATYATRLKAACERRGIQSLGMMPEASPPPLSCRPEPDQALTPLAFDICQTDVQENISLAIECLANRISGKGRGVINSKREDGASAELATAQIWQWIHHEVPVTLDDGSTRHMDADWLAQLLQTEVARILEANGSREFHRKHYGSAMRIFQNAATADVLPDFVASAAYDVMNALD
ncbi:MAG: malate synthase A [Rhodobacteraceae bacterium]|nr:malate synthase A [Paracoccaceae bacterium]